MNHRTIYGTGWIEVICGSMFSGKTEELLRRIKRAQIARQKIQLFKPSTDQRYSSNHVQSHNSLRHPSIGIELSTKILEHVEDSVRVVGIDEAQFFDEKIVEVVQKLANRGIRIILAGLDMDFLGEPFGPMPSLLAIAEEVSKLSAVCVLCGSPASRTQRIHSPPGQSDKKVVIGASEYYEARCRSCHDPKLEFAQSGASITSTSGLVNEPPVTVKNYQKMAEA